MKIDIISGFLGAGKTTLIKKILQECSINEKVVVLENEFGEVGLDSIILKECNINVFELYSGCVCCTLRGDFLKAIKIVEEKYNPERIIIEPSGVSDLLNVLATVNEIVKEDKRYKVNIIVTVIDALNYETYSNMFGDFYINQIKNSRCIVISKVAKVGDSVEDVIKDIRKYNPNSIIFSIPFELLDIKELEAKSVIKKTDNNNSLHRGSPSEVDVVSFEITRKFSLNDLSKKINAIIHDEQFGIILRIKGIVKSTSSTSFKVDYTPGDTIIEQIPVCSINKISVIGENIHPENIHSFFRM